MTTTPTNSAEALPELPEPFFRIKFDARSVKWTISNDGDGIAVYSEAMTHDHARAAILADRARAATVKSIDDDPRFNDLLSELICAHRFGKSHSEAHSNFVAHIDSLLAARPSAAVSVPELSVQLGTMHESNGNITYDVRLFKGANLLTDSHSVYTDTIKGRAEYERDSLKHFLGLGPEPDMLAYDTDAASPLPEAAKAEPVTGAEDAIWAVFVAMQNGLSTGGFSGAVRAGLAQLATSPPQAEPVSTAGAVKDHIIREVVNALRDVAIQFHGAGQLRSRIQDALSPLTDAIRTPPAVTAPDMSAREAKP